MMYNIWINSSLVHFTFSVQTWSMKREQYSNRAFYFLNFLPNPIIFRRCRASKIRFVNQHRHQTFVGVHTMGNWYISHPGIPTSVSSRAHVYSYTIKSNSLFCIDRDDDDLQKISWCRGKVGIDGIEMSAETFPFRGCCVFLAASNWYEFGGMVD